MSLTEKKIVIWEASDGAEFRRVDVAVAHERQLQLSKIFDDAISCADTSSGEIAETVFNNFSMIQQIMTEVTVVKEDENGTPA